MIWLPMISLNMVNGTIKKRNIEEDDDDNVDGGN